MMNESSDDIVLLKISLWGRRKGRLCGVWKKKETPTAVAVEG